MTAAFDDLLTANRAYAPSVAAQAPFDGVAKAGVGVITCMDSRIEPLAMLGLSLGDAKIIRTPGGQLTPDAFNGCMLAVLLLGVRRILVVPHTRCAMAAGDDAAIRANVRERTGVDLGERRIGGVTDQDAKLRTDVETLRAEPIIADRAEIGGFRYDVDTGLLTQVC